MPPYVTKSELYGYSIKSFYLHVNQMRPREGNVLIQHHTADECQSGLEPGFPALSPRSYSLGQVPRNGNYGTKKWPRRP